MESSWRPINGAVDTQQSIDLSDANSLATSRNSATSRVKTRRIIPDDDFDDDSSDDDFSDDESIHTVDATVSGRNTDIREKADVNNSPTQLISDISGTTVPDQNEGVSVEEACGNEYEHLFRMIRDWRNRNGDDLSLVGIFFKLWDDH